jgi:hypothetical protein
MLARGQPMLRSWLEAQPIVVIGIVVFVIAYSFTAIVFVLIAYSPASYRRHYKQLSPVTVTALSLVLGVLLGFLASRVWANFDRATGLVRQEASALAQVLIYAETTPPVTRARLREIVGAHVRSILDEEWPAMARRERVPREHTPPLTEALTAILAFTPTQHGDGLAQTRALAAVEVAFDSRRNRINIGSASMDRSQWRLILILFALLIVTVGMVHADDRISCAIALFLVASASASAFVLLLGYDHPFNARGGVFVEPTLLRELLAQ